jgi:5-bromo-4-chloroindolyl phosphate hydrolysis protein
MNPQSGLRKPKRFVKKTLQRYSPRGLFLYILPSALIPAVIISLGKGHVWNIIVNASAFTLFMLAAVCMRRGLRAELEYQQSRLASPPKLPLKLIAAIIMALATGWIAWQGAQQSLLVSIIYAAGTLLGMYFSYGFDPRRSNSISSAQGYSGDEILAMLQESSQKIRNIELANDKISNSELNQRIEKICDIADNILAQIQSDPRDIRRARKFLNVYLDGAKQVTEGYAQTHLQNQSGELEQNFRNVLETIELVFSEQQQKLLEDDIFDLDVKIEVLNNQLKREGIL